MGKDTGFLEYNRQQDRWVSPEQRIKSFDEFHIPLPAEERKRQGGRCMSCGVPFCQSGMVLSGMRTGCPLHNLIPEWNDEIYNGNMQHALSRLMKTNNFPEFTGRVCPALCECACTCGYNGDPVTIRDNELAVIEYGFENGLISDEPPKVRTDKKVAVIGSGPSGLAVADRLNMRGHNVTVFERSDRVGGLLMYGIPNMKIDKKIVERRIDLMRRQGVRFVTDFNLNSRLKARQLLDSFDAVVLCVGACKPRDIFRGEWPAKSGVYYAVDYLTNVTKHLLDGGKKVGEPISAKGKSVVIVGGGDTGNDCVATSIRQGCKSVLQIEMMPEPSEHRRDDNPWPEYPRCKKTDYGQQEAIAVFGRDPRIYSSTISSVETDESGAVKAVTVVELETVTGENGARSFAPIKGSERKIECELLLIAAGFVGCEDKTAGALSLKLSGRGVIETDDYAAGEKIFAAGDCKNGQSLVVTAISDGRQCAKRVDEYLMGYTNLI